MLVLGIDPGIAITGYAFLASDAQGEPKLIEYGVIDLTAVKENSGRLLLLFDKLDELILKHKPNAAAIEKLFFQKNVKTAMAVSEGRGVVQYCLARHGLPVREFTPNEVKLAVTSSGSADKRQVQEMVRILLNLEQVPSPDDAADAIAIALSALGTFNYESLMQG